MKGSLVHSRNPSSKSLALVALASLLFIIPCYPAVTLPSLFSDHMVLQRDMAVPIWGTATTGESITVKLGSQQASTKSGADGKWLVRLPAQGAGGPFDMTVTGSTTVTVKDIYLGEVWIATGQSNMDYRVHCTFSGCKLNNETQEIAAADFPLIRSCNIPFAPSDKPATDAKTQWLVCNPQNAPDFSAAGYFFAREVHKSMPTVAVGIIHSSYGASTIQCWMSRTALMANPKFAPLVTQFEQNAPDYKNQHNPYVCYNGQINPLIPYAIRGVLWAQGESVTWGNDTYRDLQVEEITSWRKAWGQDFTFLITQLANYSTNTSGWPILREAQLQATQIVSNTGLAVAIDIGDATNVHYGDKQDMGQRLGIAARGIAYGQSLPYSGPVYDRMAVEGGKVRLFFKFTKGGMAFKAGTATAFEIAGSTGAYVAFGSGCQRNRT
jgi:sialate O-acetylesterase